MPANTSIEWTDATWNPMRGCTRLGPECVRCYAEAIARRFSGPGKPFEGLIHANGSWNGKIKLAPDHLLDPIRWSTGRQVFVDSMTDLFHEGVPFEYIAKVYAVMSITCRHTYQVLTKRPERAVEFYRRWLIDETMDEHYDEREYWITANGGSEVNFHPKQVNPLEVYPEWKPWRKGERRGGYDNCGPVWPLVNLWFGVSCGIRDAKPRIDLLRRIPATVRFLSLEPLLEDLGTLDLRGINWLIAGGESGPKARPMHPNWVRSIRDQCNAAQIPFFFKQWGQWAHGDQPDFMNRYSAEHGDGRDADGFRWPDGSMSFKVKSVKQLGADLDGHMWRESPDREPWK